MSGGLRYRNEIDGLRALAVGAVIANHFDDTILPSGYLGVDIFFVISGYVISLSLCGREHRSLGQVLLGFYARRLKRLLPALIVCVLVTAVLISLFDSTPVVSLRTGMSALFGLSNLYLLKQHGSYFSGTAERNSFTHTWSLGVEEQFYLIFPIVLWLLLQRSAGKVRTFYAVMIVASVLSGLAFARIGAQEPMTAFYLMPLRFWELGIGCLIAVYHFRKGRPETTSWRSSATLVMILLCASLFAPRSAALVATVTVVALTGAALATVSPGSPAYRALTSRPATYLGLISYSLYLWHWPVLALSRFTIGVHWTTAPLLLAAAVLAAMASYHWVEKPLRAASWGTEGRTVALGIAAAIVAAGFVAILAWPLSGRLYLGQPAHLSDRDRHWLTTPYRIPGTSYTWAGPPCVLENDTDAGRQFPIGACTLGHFDQARRRVMVFGNSFSAAFVPAFDALVRDDVYAVTLTSSWGASPVAELPVDSAWPHTSAYYWNTAYPAMVSHLRPGDWVFLMNTIERLAPAKRDAAAARDLALFETGLRRSSAELARHGVRLAVLDVAPLIYESDCVPEVGVRQWFTTEDGPCSFLSRAESIARGRAVHDLLRKLEGEHLLFVVDLFNTLCPGRTCTFEGAGKQVLYRDNIHPSEGAARAVAPLIRALLTRPVDGPTVAPPSH